MGQQLRTSCACGWEVDRVRGRGRRRDPRPRPHGAQHGRHPRRGASRAPSVCPRRPTPSTDARAKWTRARTPPGPASSRSSRATRRGRGSRAVVEGARRHLPGARRRRRLDRRHRRERRGRRRARSSARSPTRARARRCGRASARALDEGYDAVLTLDADGQHDPDEIPRFVAAFGAPGAGGPAAGADHRPPRLRPDAARPAAVQHARDRGLLVGRRPARPRQPVGLPAARPAAHGRDARQPTSRASSSRSR